ncbi:hypothetical protein E8E11_001142 [Didymella keratinophila]|nr:hypothetical protein E8E11_001142 [Didymella keratinophila]
MSTQLNHATSPPSPLPKTLPWALSPSASPRQNTAPVDLAVPYESGLLPNTRHLRLQGAPRNSKRRSVTEQNSRQALREARAGQEQGLICEQIIRRHEGTESCTWPDAGKGVQPMNTLNGPLVFGTNPAHGKNRTYAKAERNAAKLSGREVLFPGSEQYRQQRLGQRTANLSGHGVVHTSSTKRRKTENPNATAASPVEIPDDDDEVVPSPQRASTPQTRSILSLESPRSSISKHSGTEPKPASQPTSEFKNTEWILDPRRNTRSRPRRPGSKGAGERRKGSPAVVPFIGAGSQPEEQAFAIYDDYDPTPQAPRSAILQGHEQGVDSKPSQTKAQRSTGLKSRHFKNNSKMNVNESIAGESAKDDNHRTAAAQAGSRGSSKNLRDFRHADHEDDPISGSEDDLADTSKARPRQSLSTTMLRADARQQNDTTGTSYRLRYARSYNLNVSSRDLRLRQVEPGLKTYRVTTLDGEGNVQTLDSIDLGRVNRSDFDNFNRIRLLGPSKDGGRYWFDLQFAEDERFRNFRDNHVLRECLQGLVHTNTIMIDMFKKPLQWNDKIGKSPMVNGRTSSSQVPNGQGSTPVRNLIAGLTHEAEDADSSILTKPAASTRSRPREARATRATAPIYDREVTEEKEPERYSVIRGLGKRWAKPLDYSVNSGFLKRRKATIEYDDLEKLDEGQMLNDSIMTFYMLYLFEKLQVSIDQVYFFNTHFFPTLTKKGKGQDGINYEGVRSWTKRDDVFSYDYLVVPMHEDLHWYLGIICNVNNIKRKPKHEPLQRDSQDLNQGPGSLHASDLPTAPSNDINSAKTSELIVATSALDDAADTKDGDNDDVNLFEEEKDLDLIDPNAETADGHEHNFGERIITDEVSMAAIPPAAPKDSSSKLASGRAKQASKKKRNYKPPARDPDKPVIVMLDSLGQTRTAATRALRQWLEAEGRDKRGLEVEIDNKGIYPKGAQIPTQNNYSDCGLYVLGYLRRFFMNPDEFTKKLIRYEMSAESDWPDMDPSKMREEIRDLIFELNSARNSARREAYKAKKNISSNDSSDSSTKAGSKEVSPTVKQTEAAETRNAAAAAAATTGKTVAPPADAPRLGSPFRPESRNEKRASPAIEATQKNNTARASLTEQNLLNASTTTPVRQRQSLAKRANSPEVRVPATLPLEISTYKPFDSASDPSTQPTQQPADLRISQQDSDSRGKDNGKPFMPSAKSSRVSSPSKSLRERPAILSPLQARTQSGSHGDPIPVDDSQDLDVRVRTQSQSAGKLSPEMIELDRSQESVHGPARRVQRHTQSSPIRQREARRQVVKRDDSIREVDGREWEERHDPDIMRAIEVSLEDERKRLNRPVNQQPQVLDQSMEDVFDAQAAYSRSSHTVHEVQETQESQVMDIDNDDRVVQESPVQQRGSPSSDIMMMD